MSKQLETISLLKENSGVSSDSLKENTAVTDVVGTEQIVGAIIDEKYKGSLAYQICSVQPMTSSFGRLYTSRKQTDSNDLEVVTRDINVQAYTVSSGFTQEVFHDMTNMYNKTSDDSGLKILSGLSHQDENKKLMVLLNSESTIKPELTINDSGNLESILFQLSRKVSESVLEINQEAYKGLDSFCIVSKHWAAAVLGSFDYMKDGQERDLFIGRIGRTDFYVNPFSDAMSEFTDAFDYAYEIEETSVPDYCYVGIISEVSGNSSLTFAPYSYESNFVPDPDTGNLSLFLINRYGLVTSPLHKPLENKSMLHKFALIKG